MSAAPPSEAAAEQAPLLFELTVPARADRLKLIRDAVGRAAADLDWPDEAVQDFVLAVDEACQNVVRHAYRDTGEGPLTVRATGRGGCLTVRLIDRAPPVDPASLRPRELDDLRPGGLGTRLIRELVDEVGFETPPAEGGNVLRLTKRIG